MILFTLSNTIDIHSQNSILSVLLLFLLLSLNPLNLYGFWCLSQKLDEREALPNRLESFPILPTSRDNYLKAWKKVEVFKEEVLKGNSCQLLLSQDEINHIHLKGNSINKYQINEFYRVDPLVFKYSSKYSFFLLMETSLVRKDIEYCTISCIGKPEGIKTETTEIKFSTRDGEVKQSFKRIEYNGRNISNESWETLSSLSTSRFLEFILTGDLEFYNCDNKSHKSVILKIISRIRLIQIFEGFILIQTLGEP
jgi:hypothetical protein